MIGHRRGPESGGCCDTSRLAWGIAYQRKRLLLAPKPPLASRIKPLEHFRLFKALFDMRLYRLPNHLDLWRSVIRCAEV
jgi:hypothetical protein